MVTERGGRASGVAAAEASGGGGCPVVHAATALAATINEAMAWRGVT